MARRHGRNGMVYLELASGTNAVPLNFQARWNISFTTDKGEVTSLGDSNKVYVAGLPDASGAFSGYYDDASVQSYSAAVDGIARKWYLYPDRLNTPTQYWYGQILPDFSVDGAVDGPVAVSCSWNAASAIGKMV